MSSGSECCKLSLAVVNMKEKMLILGWNIDVKKNDSRKRKINEIQVIKQKLLGEPCREEETSRKNMKRKEMLIISKGVFKEINRDYVYTN